MERLAPAMVFVIIFAAFILLIILARSARIVKQSEKGLILRLGKYHATADSGLNFLTPLVDEMVKVDMREQVINVEPQKVITRDNVTVIVIDVHAVGEVRDTAGGRIGAPVYLRSAEDLRIPRAPHPFGEDAGAFMRALISGRHDPRLMEAELRANTLAPPAAGGFLGDSHRHTRDLAASGAPARDD